MESGAPVPLPAEYLTFLSLSNGGEGDLGIEPGWVSFWPAEGVLEHNAAYRLAELVPGLFGFGSNGAGELLAFDTRAGLPYPVVTVPFIPLAFAQASVVAPDFRLFAQAVGTPLPAA